MVRFYDSNGKYAAYCGDFRNLYDQFGRYIGYFLNNLLYNLSGESIGYVKEKVVFDHSGKKLFFTS